MSELDDLWWRYGQRARPSNISDAVDEVRLGELDDEIQDVVSSYFGKSAGIAPAQVARLGLALADLTRVLPNITPSATYEYFVMVETLARGTLAALLLQEKHEC